MELWQQNKLCRNFDGRRFHNKESDEIRHLIEFGCASIKDSAHKLPRLQSDGARNFESNEHDSSRKVVEKGFEISFVNWAAFVQPKTNSAVHVFEKYERPSSARVIKSPAHCQGLFLQKRMVAGRRWLSAK